MTENIETLSRRRRILLSVYGISFMGLQALFFQRLDAPLETWRPVQYAFAAGYIGWAGTLIYVLATGGFLFRGRSAATRAALNDELTVANRRFAYWAGYVIMMGTIVVLYVLSRLDATNLQEALRVLLAIGAAVPAVVFAGRERKQSA
jgi:hypothetical protein